MVHAGTGIADYLYSREYQKDWKKWIVIMNDNQLVNRKRSRLTLIFLVLVFIMPVALAFLFYLNPQWQPAGTKNFGTLYNSPVSLGEFTLQTRQGETFTREQLRGKWSLIYIGGSTCEQACREALYKAGAARIAQGTEAGRINVYYLLATEHFAGDIQTLQKDYPRLIMLRGTAGQRETLIRQFAISADHMPGSDNRLYLVDPPGNLILHYPSGFRDIGLMEDLKHLLKWSQVG
jgi:cytochrome oxidase Cu insertion factor (SCO1/SenC/PrrC family)